MEIVFTKISINVPVYVPVTTYFRAMKSIGGVGVSYSCD